MRMRAHVPVLIVGGSLNGLTMAVLLGQLGVEVMLIERHPATTVQYKFSGISPRSMEIYRTAGLEDAIRRHATGDQKKGEIARARNLSDPDVQFIGKAWSVEDGLSATTAATCDQDILEPILRAQAERFGAVIHFHTELLSFEQDGECVRALVHSRDTGREKEVIAQYLIGADGSRSMVRQALGIALDGPGVLQDWMNLIFDTDLAPVLRGRPLTSCFVTDVNGSIVPRSDRWLLAVQFAPDRGERPDDFDEDRVAALVRKAAGHQEVAVKLFDVREWQVSASIAEQFKKGRVFLIGDAAHTIPPTGGFGGNTGIHDAHNLAWKLALVLQGHADAGLLDSYDAERRHVAQRTLDQALGRLASWFKNMGQALPETGPVVDDLNVILGQIYPEGALLADGIPWRTNFEDPRMPSGRPGTRAPHIEIERAGARSGIHDLFGRRFVLLSRDAIWRAGAQALRISGVPISGFQIGVGPNAMRDGADLIDIDERFGSRYHVSEQGAVLVRPDGVIAWRTDERSPNPREVLTKTLGAIYC
jgi:2-polyprenyl-6-methoxyphenol hydroxylase-like FAD-dependent oxidoreductase